VTKSFRGFRAFSGEMKKEGRYSALIGTRAWERSSGLSNQERILIKVAAFKSAKTSRASGKSSTVSKSTETKGAISYKNTLNDLCSTKTGSLILDASVFSLPSMGIYKDTGIKKDTSGLPAENSIQKMWLQD